MELDLTVATVMLSEYVGLTDCGDACCPVQVPHFCLTVTSTAADTAFPDSQSYHSCSSEGRTRLLGAEDGTAEYVRSDCK